MFLRKESSRVTEEVRSELYRFVDTCERFFRSSLPLEEIEKFHHPDFIYYYANKSSQYKAIKHDRKKHMEDFSQVAKEYTKIGGVSLLIPWHKVMLRSSEEAIISYEICQTGPILWDRALFLQDWRKTNGEWQIYREFDEQEGRKIPSLEQVELPTLHRAKMDLIQAYQDDLPSILPDIVSNPKVGISADHTSQENGSYIWFDEVKHVEMLSQDHGVICYHIHLTERITRKNSHSIHVDHWRKTNGSWKRIKQK